MPDSHSKGCCMSFDFSSQDSFRLLCPGMCSHVEYTFSDISGPFDHLELDVVMSRCSICVAYCALEPWCTLVVRDTLIDGISSDCQDPGQRLRIEIHQSTAARLRY